MLFGSSEDAGEMLSDSHAPYSKHFGAGSKKIMAERQITFHAYRLH